MFQAKNKLDNYSVIKKSAMSDDLDLLKFYANKYNKQEKKILAECLLAEYDLNPSIDLVLLLIEFGVKITIQHLQSVWCDDLGYSFDFYSTKEKNWKLINFYKNEVLKNMDHYTENEKYDFITELFSKSDPDLNFIEKILKSNAIDINYQSNNKEGYLFCAISSCIKERIVPLLIKYGANLSLQNSNGNTPLHQSCLNFNKVITPLLLQNTNDINIKNNKGETPFIFLLYSRFSDTQEGLDFASSLKKQSDNISNEVIEKAVIEAFKDQDQNKLAWLKKNYSFDIKMIKIKPDNHSLLEHTAENCFLSSESLKLLLSNGLEVNFQDRKGNTFLHKVAISQSIDVLKILASYKEIKFDIENHKQQTPLDLFISRINLRDINPKEYALSNENKEALLILIDKTSNLSSNRLYRLFCFCLASNQLAYLEILKKRYGNQFLEILRDKNKNFDFLLFASYSRKLAGFTWLISNNIRLDQVDTSGKTILHANLYARNIEVCEYLIKNGVKLNNKDKQSAPLLKYLLHHKNIVGYPSPSSVYGNDDIKLLKLLLSNKIDLYDRLMDDVIYFNRYGSEFSHRNDNTKYIRIFLVTLFKSCGLQLFKQTSYSNKKQIIQLLLNHVHQKSLLALFKNMSINEITLFFNESKFIFNEVSDATLQELIKLYPQLLKITIKGITDFVYSWNDEVPFFIFLVLRNKSACLESMIDNNIDINDNHFYEDEKKNSLIHALAYKGNLALFNKLLETNNLIADLNEPIQVNLGNQSVFPQKNYTPLELAIIEGHEKMALALIKAGATVNNFKTPILYLLLKSKKEQLELLEYLLKDDILKNQQYSPIRPIPQAASKNFKRSFNCLIKYATLSLLDMYQTASHGNLDMIKILLEKFQSSQLKVEHKFNLLNCAVNNKDKKVFDYFYKKFSLSIKDFMSPSGNILHLLIETANSKAIKEIIESKQSILKYNMHGETPTVLALMLNNNELYKSMYIYDKTTVSKYFNIKNYNLLKKVLISKELIPEKFTIDLNRSCYKLITLFNTVDKVLAYIDKHTNSRRVLHDLSLFSIPITDKWIPSAWSSLALIEGPTVLTYLNLAPNIEKLLGRPPKSINDIKEISFCLTYPNENKNIIMARLFKKHKVSDYIFDIVEKNYIAKKSDLLPNICIKGSDLSSDLSRYTLIKLPSNDLRGFILGDLTGCCQIVGSAGHWCAMHGMMSPNGGFYVIVKNLKPGQLAAKQKLIKRLTEADTLTDFLNHQHFKKLKQLKKKFSVQIKQYRRVYSDSTIKSLLLDDLKSQTKGEIIAQCWSWISVSEQALVIDSWERFRKEDDQLCAPFLFAFAKQVVLNSQFSKVVIGTGGQTPTFLKTNCDKATLLERPKDYLGYRDSKEEQLILHKLPKNEKNISFHL